MFNEVINSSFGCYSSSNSGVGKGHLQHHAWRRDIQRHGGHLRVAELSRSSQICGHGGHSVTVGGAKGTRPCIKLWPDGGSLVSL